VGFSELLQFQKDKIPADKRDQFINNIYASAKRTFTLLENLLAWARSQSGRMVFKPQSTNLIQLIHSNVLLLKESSKEKKIELIIKSTLNENQIAFCDSNMIDTVIRNLLSNAIKYTFPGGKITVSLTADKKLNLIKVKVADMGIGIPSDRIEKLFDIDRTYSTDGTAGETGTGLGLILCKEFVDKNGGRIWVESKPDQGSVFIFTLPMHVK
jgi:signal transduction histidine kinase